MNLDWKWIGIGFAIMLALGLLSSLIVLGFYADDLRELAEAAGGDPSAIDPSQIPMGSLAMIALLNLLVYVVGGFIVGIKSAGRTILEPAIAAALAVALSLVLSGNLSIGGLLAGGVLPFLAALFGGWLGEKRQESKAAP